MNQELASYNIHNLHLHDATLDEEMSFNYLNWYLTEHVYNYSYSSPPLNSDSLHILISNFALFYAKIKILDINESRPSNKPLYVFRYLMLEDGSWSPYYVVRKKSGYVVEGMSWSNGLFYQVREDKEKDFQIHQMYLTIDSITKTMYSFPDMEQNGDPF